MDSNDKQLVIIELKDGLRCEGVLEQIDKVNLVMFLANAKTYVLNEKSEVVPKGSFDILKINKQDIKIIKLVQLDKGKQNEVTGGGEDKVKINVIEEKTNESTPQEKQKSYIKDDFFDNMSSQAKRTNVNLPVKYDDRNNETFNMNDDRNFPYYKSSKTYKNNYNGNRGNRGYNGNRAYAGSNYRNNTQKGGYGYNDKKGGNFNTNGYNKDRRFGGNRKFIEQKQGQGGFTGYNNTNRMNNLAYASKADENKYYTQNINNLYEEEKYYKKSKETFENNNLLQQKEKISFDEGKLLAANLADKGAKPYALFSEDIFKK